MARIIGDGRDDTLIGGERDDRIEGRGGDDSLSGRGGDDLIEGGEGDDRIEDDDDFGAAPGDDTVRGGLGDDSIEAGPGSDLIEGGDGDDLVFLRPGANDVAEGAVSTLSGGDGFDIVSLAGSARPLKIVFSLDGEVVVNGEARAIATGFEATWFNGFNGGDYNVVGTEGLDFFFTKDGNDTLQGRGGDDSMIAGSGDDRVNAGAGADNVSLRDLGRDRVDMGGGDDLLAAVLEAPPAGGDVATFDGGRGQDVIEFLNEPADFDGATIRVDGVVVATVANFEAIELRGSRIQGLAGDDTIGGSRGDDRLHGHRGDDRVFAESGADTLNGGGGDDDVVLGDFGRDRVDLGSGDDRLELSPGVEPSGEATGAFDGGTGHDVLVFANGVGEDGISFNGSVISFDGTILAEVTNFETVYLAGRRIVGLAGDDTIEGTEQSDRLAGREGADQLYAGEGRDRLLGEAGDDIVFLELDDRKDVVDGGAGNDELVLDATAAIVMTGRMSTGLTVTVGASTACVATGFEALDIQDSTGDDRLLGDVGDDSIAAGSGRDAIMTRAGDDELILTVDSFIDRVDMGAGIDLAALYAFSAADVMAEFEASGLIVTLDGRTVARISNAEVFTIFSLSGDDRLSGGALADVLSAGSGRNELNGFGGDDELAVDLDATRDRVSGGAGDDLLVVTTDSSLEGPNDGLVTEVTGEGVFRITLGDRVLLEADSIEQVNLSGGGSENLLIGQAMADVLRSGLDRDTLIGAAGDDTLIGAESTARMDGGRGEDTADLSRVSFAIDLTLDSRGTASYERISDGEALARLIDIEHAVGGDFNDRIKGDASDNVIDGFIGSDTLDGGDGTDTLSFASLENFDVEVTLGGPSGGSAVETDRFDGFTFQNVVRSFENVIGSSGDDTIEGDAADNRIAGGDGSDALTGGQGADVFVFANEPDRFGFEQFDLVRDFSSAQGDRLDLTALAADPENATSGPLAFIGGAAFSGAGGEVRFERSGSDTLVLIDLDGDRKSDQQLELDGRVDLSEADFILG